MACSRVNFTYIYVRFTCMTFKNTAVWTTHLDQRQPAVSSFILFVELQWANLWNVRDLQLGISTKGFSTRRVNFPACPCLRLLLNTIYITHTQHVDENFIPQQKSFGSESVRLHKIFWRRDKSYFSTFESMHRENVKRKIMKIENRQVCCEQKC
jgi:hypothetical protein